MADIIDVNIGDSTLEVFWQDEVELNLDMALMYIKSGEAEIQKYVDEVSKPEISNYVETEAKPLVTQIINEIAEPTVMEYIDGTVKPDLDEYADSLKPELQAYVTQASNYADNSQASATASAGSAAAALTSANNAKTSETNAKTYENNALSSKNAAASSATSASNYANNSKIWAEGTDAQVQALGGSKSAKGWAEASENLNYTDITNCITAIPQDIKLELNNGTLTLKAGSKVYKADGTVVPVSQDASLQDWGTNEKVLVFYRNYSVIPVMSINRCYSGSNAPNSPTNGGYWLDTTNKVIKQYNSSTTSWDNTSLSLPIAIVTMVGDGTSKIASIDQVFNGFGYIGSTRFTLGSGVKVLAPNGRNTDGSLNSIEYTLKFSIFSRYGNNSTIYYTDGNGVNNYGPYYEQSEKPSTRGLWYNPDDNYMRLSTDNATWTIVKQAFIGIIKTDSTGRITSFKPKTTFQATDYYDVPKLAGDNTFTGNNTFSGDNTINNALPILYGENTSDLTNKNGMGLTLRGADSAGHLWSYIDLYRRGESKTSEAHMYVRNARGKIAEIAIVVNDKGTVVATAPTPVTGSNSTQIATTAFVNSFITNLSSTVGSGYVYVGNLLIQWGTWNEGTTTFPKPFANTNYGMAILGGYSANNADNWIKSISTTGFTAQKRTDRITKYITIGQRG